MKLPRRPLRARTRLTLWFVALLGATLLAVGGLTIWAVGRILSDNLDDLLRSRAAGVEAKLELDRGRLALEAEGSLPDLVAGLDVVRIWDRDRRPIFQRDLTDGLAPVDPAFFERVLDGQAAYATLRTVGGAGVRIYAQPVRDRGRVLGLVLVGRAEVEIESALARLRLLGIGGLVAALLLGWAGGTFLAGRALEPVERITRAAERIGADDLSRRLGLTLPDDELGHLAAAFDGMIDRLDRAFQRQRRFTADASHELRTPLAIIRSQAEVALARPRDPSYYARVLGSIREEAERLGRLAESLLVLARGDAGQSLDLAPLDLDELLAEVGGRIAPVARTRGVRLEVTAEEVGPVVGDAAWLTQLLLNLLDNALRHTPAGGRVALRLDPAADGVTLTVADSGEGIAPEHLPHLFERFYRVDRARSRAEGGSGLGLAICDWIARAHGGRLSVASELGRGTSVTLWLPLASDAAGSAGRAESTAPAPQSDRLVDRAEPAAQHSAR